MSNPVAVAKFGKDHWSTLAYVECCCVDGVAGLGRLALGKMRCNEARHPLLASNFLSAGWESKYSTRLAGFFNFEGRSNIDEAIAAGVQVLGHDDWDCLDDLEAAGYVEIISLANAAVKMTDLGSAVAGKLRAHKAGGGHFAGFVLSDSSVERAAA